MSIHDPVRLAQPGATIGECITPIGNSFTTMAKHVPHFSIAATNF